jgi:membrane protein DedA with SNARE-associated domain
LDEHALLALFVWLLLEEAGLPMPVPGDLVILAAGARLGYGQFHWGVAVLLIEAATLLGSTALFWIARWGGRPLLLRFGRYLHVDAARLARTEASCSAAALSPWWPAGSPRGCG